MRIALLTRRFDPSGGGTERDLMVTAECLTQAGHGVSIYTSQLRTTSSPWPVVRIHAPGRVLGLLWFAYRAPALARERGADLLVSFARTVGADVMRSGGSAHRTYVGAARAWKSNIDWLRMRLSPYHRAQMHIERRGFASRRLRLVVAVSGLVRADLMRSFQLSPERVITLYNGVEIERFKPAADITVREAMRRELGIAPQDKVVAFVGNGFARKGLSFLLQAWPQVEQAPWLVVAGADRELASNERQARRLKIAERVRFLGAMRNVERLYQAADALALPSLFEPFGNVVMEAMASGLPVLVSSKCGAAEVVPDAMRSFVVQDPTDPGEIAAQLSALLAESDSRNQLATAARATAEMFTWQRYADELNLLLRSLC